MITPGEQLGETVALIRTRPTLRARRTSLAFPARPVRAEVSLRPAARATTLTDRCGRPRTVTFTRTVVLRRTTTVLRESPIEQARTGAPGVVVCGVAGGDAAIRVGGAAGVIGGPDGSTGVVRCSSAVAFAATAVADSAPCQRRTMSMSPAKERSQLPT